MSTKTIFLIIALIFSSSSFTQESNAELLKELKTELSSAVEKEDYEKAAKLKKEIEIRQQIEGAVKNGNYEEAARLKKQLSGSEIRVGVEEAVESSDVYHHKFPKPTKGKAIIEFVKVTVQGWNAETMLFDDNRYIGSVWGVSHTRIEVDPGKHLFWMSITDKIGYLDANLEANKVYIVIIDMAETAFSNVALSPATMDDVSLVDRAKRVINKHTLKVTPQVEITHKQAKLDKKGFIEKHISKYEKKYKSSAKTTELRTDMDVPLGYLRQ